MRAIFIATVSVILTFYSVILHRDLSEPEPEIMVQTVMQEQESDNIKGFEFINEKDTPQLYCMAVNIYHEARSDNLAGQFAVADVVLNRVEDDRWPNTICEVVYQGPVAGGVPVRDRCQFSWYCDGKADTINQEAAWRRSQMVAYQIVENGLMRGISEGSTHFHATYVNPRWGRIYPSIGRIGLHIFYRKP